jgi:hypothetical protein
MMELLGQQVKKPGGSVGAQQFRVWLETDQRSRLLGFFTKRLCAMPTARWHQLDRLDTTPTFAAMAATKTTPASRTDRGRRRRISSDDVDDDAGTDDVWTSVWTSGSMIMASRPTLYIASVHRVHRDHRPSFWNSAKKKSTATTEEHKPRRKLGRPRKENPLRYDNITEATEPKRAFRRNPEGSRP